jgi:predicted nucleic acid-binding protein
MEFTGKGLRYTSCLTFFEVEATFKRKLNKKELTVREYETVQEDWLSIQPGLTFVPLEVRVVRTGGRLQKLYGLRPADTAQLGSAAVMQAEHSEISFVSLDEQLSRYARLEGFKVPAFS